eukprot:TRINITY_DN1922_c0_g1_i2.p1 TRINITY_DN1922_c0_g1~~TRINITY_DN1922_c0_g1_i2.p1  ORF type:complete len:100 (+),score=13.85 TRINITY_DN1922_c0_g1_i2:459-758(+)
MTVAKGAYLDYILNPFILLPSLSLSLALSLSLIHTLSSDEGMSFNSGMDSNQFSGMSSEDATFRIASDMSSLSMSGAYSGAYSGMYLYSFTEDNLKSFV